MINFYPDITLPRENKKAGFPPENSDGSPISVHKSLIFAIWWKNIYGKLLWILHSEKLTNLHEYGQTWVDHLLWPTWLKGMDALDAIHHFIHFYAVGINLWRYRNKFWSQVYTYVPRIPLVISTAYVFNKKAVAPRL